MSGVRVLVGTRKGAFVLTSDAKRERWDISDPHFAGWEIYHLKGSPTEPNRLYASQSSGWFGQIIQRSDDGGKTWHQPGTPPGEPTTAPDGTPKGESNKFVYDTSSETGKPLTTHQWYDGTAHPWEFKRVWHPNHRSPIRTRFTPAWKTPPCSARPMAESLGTSSPACAATAQVTNGRRAPEECACTQSFWIRAIKAECSPPSLRRAPFAPMMAAKHGGRSIAAFIRFTSPIPPPRSAIAFTASRCTGRARTRCSCRNTGT